MVKLFGGYVLMALHQADRSPQISLLLLQLQGRLYMDLGNFSLCYLKFVAAANHLILKSY